MAKPRGRRASVEARLRSLREHCRKLDSLALELHEELDQEGTPMERVLAGDAIAPLPKTTKAEDVERLALFHAQSQMVKKKARDATAGGAGVVDGGGGGGGGGGGCGGGDDHDGHKNHAAGAVLSARELALRHSADATAGSEAITVVSVAPEDTTTSKAEVPGQPPKEGEGEEEEEEEEDEVSSARL